jgi:hypothetical protein
MPGLIMSGDESTATPKKEVPALTDKFTKSNILVAVFFFV